MSQRVFPGLYVSGGTPGPPGPPPQIQPLGPVRFIDPQNDSGVASDANDGSTDNNVPPGSGPILTTGHLNELLLLREVTADTTITYMSDDTSGTLLDLSTLLIDAGVILTFQGTPVVLHTGGTLNAGTVAIDPSAAGGGQHQTLHTTDIADWTPFISQFEQNGFGTAPHPTYLLDTTAGDGTSAWIASDGGGDAPQDVTTADAGRPVNSALAAATLTIGDSYTIQRGSLLALAGGAGIVGNSAYFFGVTDVIVFKDFAFTLESVGINGCTYTRCSFENEQTVGGFFNHCFLSSDIIELGLPGSKITLVAGVVYTTGLTNWSPPFQVSGDTYFTGVYFLLGQSQGIRNPLIVAGIGAGICINRNAGGTGIQVNGGGTYELGADQTFGTPGHALVWGRDNFIGQVIGAGSCVLESASLPPTVTGASSDFEMRGVGGLRTQVARAWDDTVGAYTEAGGPPTRATTYTNLNGTIGAGGFNKAAHDVQSDAHLVLA